MLRLRWLGKVRFEEAHRLQRALHARAEDEYVLMLEHPEVLTLGVHADPANVLVDPSDSGVPVVRTDRGGDVTYHGPGQLVAYPILNVAFGPGSVPGHVASIEQVVIDVLADFGLESSRLAGCPGVWVDAPGPDARKICAVGVRVSRGRSMHGLALNVDPDMSWFGRIVPCGIADKAVTSLRSEGVKAGMEDVVEAFAARAARAWAGAEGYERQDVDSFPALRRTTALALERRPGHGIDEHKAPERRGNGLRTRLRQAGVDPEDGLEFSARKPPWLRVGARMGGDFLSLRSTVRGLGLTTVCEEAGCPNIFECWSAGTATFMINGERCTRACGFCLVDTSHPSAPDPSEPVRVADAVAGLGLEHAVITAVARDDLDDGGASAFASTVREVRERCPGTSVEILVPDCKGDEESIAVLVEARPDVFNHNLETVARLQRAVRPSAGYARSLSVLATAKDAGLVTKSGLILGMGETRDEVIGALSDIRSVGTDIVTIGQYLRPSRRHLPVARWWAPDEFESLAGAALCMGFSHVESSPLTRSSYHARDAARSASAQLVAAPVARAPG